jgi:hypothetical protein
MADESAADRRRARLKAQIDASTAPEDMIHIARAVAGADDPAIGHDQVQARLPDYVGDELAGLPLGRLHPDVKRHLDVCAACETAYLELLRLARIEAASAQAGPVEAPRPDLAFLSGPISLSDYVRALARDLTAALQPRALGDLEALADRFFQWIVRHHGRLIPVRASLAESLGYAEGELPDAALILAATQLTTQSLIDALSAEELQAQSASSRLRSTAREYAERSAQKVGLDLPGAQAFAHEYAERIGRGPGALWELSAD